MRINSVVVLIGLFLYGASVLAADEVSSTCYLKNMNLRAKFSCPKKGAAFPAYARAIDDAVARAKSLFSTYGSSGAVNPADLVIAEAVGLFDEKSTIPSHPEYLDCRWIHGTMVTVKYPKNNDEVIFIFSIDENDQSYKPLLASAIHTVPQGKATLICE